MSLISPVFGKGAQAHLTAIVGKVPRAPVGLLALEPRETGQPVLVGDGTIIGPHAIVYEGVRIGNHCLIGDGAKIREHTSIGDGCVIGMNVCIGAKCVICRNTRILDNSVIPGGTIIGENCQIAQGVLIANDNEMQDTSADIEAVTLQNDVVIKMGAMIAAGVTIGHHATIGAGSLITRDVPPETKVLTLPVRMQTEKVQ